jgi:hypothetical protein
MFMTHMPGRFVLPALVPLALLVAETLAQLGNRLSRQRGRILVSALIVAVVASALLNAWRLADRLGYEARRWQAQAPLSLAEMVDRVDLRRQFDPINHALGTTDGLAWLVGDAAVYYVREPLHYTVVFSRDPWLGAAARRSPAEAVAWLRSRNVRHVVFSWSEIRRLRDTYGFPQFVTPEWVAALRAAGLRRTDPPPDAGMPPRWEVYEVMPK